MYVLFTRHIHYSSLVVEIFFPSDAGATYPSMPLFNFFTLNFQCKQYDAAPAYYNRNLLKAQTLQECYMT